MGFSEKKYKEKLKKQRETNPGNKEKYEPLFRGRSITFKSKKEYNRKKEKINLKKWVED